MPAREEEAEALRGTLRWVLGTGIATASSGTDQHRWLSGEVTPQCISAQDDNTGQQGV
jgi:hypothetical protein